MALRILVSACLIGLPTAYDGKDRFSKELLAFLPESGVEIIIFCPEYHHFGLPREKIEIKGGNGDDFLNKKAKLVSESLRDLTKEGLKAARRFEEFIDILRPDKAYLRERSPFCGVSQIYDGSFSGRLTEGPGIASAVLARKGVKLVGVSE